MTSDSMESQNSLVILNDLSVAENLIITVRRCRRKIKGRRKTRRRRRKRGRGKKRYKTYYMLIKGKTFWNIVEAMTTAQ